MCPTFFSVESYGLLIGLGLVSGLLLLYYRSGNSEISRAGSMLVGLVALLAGAFGLRLLYWLYLPDDFVSPAVAFLQPGGGVALNGGIILILATVALICRLRGLDFLKQADLMAPSGPLAILFFRLGCYCNGCCLGRPSDLPWAVRLPDNSLAAQFTAAMAVHPTSLYAALNALLILIVLLWLDRRQSCKGSLLAVFLLMYGSLRFILDLTRRDPFPAQRQGVLDLNRVLDMNQVLNLVIGLAGAVLVAYLWRRDRKS